MKPLVVKVLSIEDAYGIVACYTVFYYHSSYRGFRVFGEEYVVAYTKSYYYVHISTRCIEKRGLGHGITGRFESFRADFISFIKAQLKLVDAS